MLPLSTLIRWQETIAHPRAVEAAQRRVEDHFIAVEHRRRVSESVSGGDEWLAEERETDAYREALRKDLADRERVLWRCSALRTFTIEMTAALEVNRWPAPVVMADAA